MKKTTILNCYVHVQGGPSEDDDEEVPGTYLVEVAVSTPVNIDKLSQTQKSEIASSVLDSFHEHIGIAVLDDFEINAYLANGESLVEDGSQPPVKLDPKAKFCGGINDEDVPFEMLLDNHRPRP